MRALLDAGEVDVRQKVTGWFGALTLRLTALTGLGLFLAQSLPDPGSWALFGCLSLVGVLAVTAVARRALDTLSDQPGSVPRVVDVTESAAPEDPAEAEAPVGHDEIDYLMALRHEFRTPLNAVLGFSDVLLSGIDGDINDSQREDLEIIRASGIRLRILLDNAFDLTQLASGDLRPDMESVDARDSVARVVVEAGQLWGDKRETRCVLPDESCMVEADEARLRRSILVLADFLATDHREATIEVKLARSEDHVAVAITAEPSDRLTLDALPNPAEVLGAEDASQIRRWPVAVTSEVIGLHGGSLYHGDSPARFLIRLPLGRAS